MNKTNKEIKKELLFNNGFIELSSVFDNKYNNSNNLYWWQKLIIKLLESKEKTRKIKIEKYLKNYNKGRINYELLYQFKRSNQHNSRRTNI